jgi:DNA-binding FrmR family transcriptional regulator
MTIQVFEGQNNEILERISKLTGQVTRAILWIEDAVPSPSVLRDVDAILADLNQDTVSVGSVDDSREALYTRLEDE